MVCVFYKNSTWAPSGAVNNPLLFLLTLQEHQHPWFSLSQLLEFSTQLSYCQEWFFQYHRP